MKKIKIYGEYTIEECTAIANCDDEHEDCRQKALLVVTSESNSGEKFEFIVFGWPMPESDEDFNDMIDDADAWEYLTDYHHCKK